MSEKQRARSHVPPGSVVAGKYRVETMLGSGGMGLVVGAKHLELDQPVALKFVLPELLSHAGVDAVERFLREARAAVRLKSEHVARVYDVGHDPAHGPFIVLELLEGMDLARLARQNGPLPVADSVEYALQACEALVEAHALGLVHRDLKPQNLFVTRRLNGTPLVKVLDFGISKGAGLVEERRSLTESTSILGSPLYMAPEQMRSARSTDVRSDIWALGVILYELLGGQLPFDGETVTEICVRVVNEEPARLLELRPGLDPRLVDIVMRCLEKDPEDRFQKVAQLAAALEPFSRSAKLGGLVRPWRSFEDTQDSQNVPRPPSTGERPLPDETAPSTAVTVAVADCVAAERGGPGGSLFALVSTPTAEATRPAVGPRRHFRVPRMVSIGAVVVLALAVGLAGLRIGRGEAASPATPPPARPIDEEAVVTPAAFVRSPVVASESATAAEAFPTPTSTRRPRKPARPEPGTPRPVAAPLAPSESVVTAPNAAQTQGAESAVPNGAPILR